MSFLDQDASPSAEVVSSGHPSEDSSYEQIIKTNIRRIRTNLLSIEENLHSLNSNLVSRDIAESLDARLKETYATVAETQQCFRDWTIYCAGNPVEKKRRKFSFRKLTTNFHNEIKRVQQLSNSVEETAKRVAENRAYISDRAEYKINSKRLGNDTFYQQPQKWNTVDSNSLEPYRSRNIGFINGDTNLYQTDVMESNELDDVTEHEALIKTKVTEERLSGLNRIHGQVLQAHQAIRDLAGLVFEQDAHLETIEGNLDYGATQSGKAVVELDKSYHSMRRRRLRQLMLLAAAICTIFGLFWLLRLPSIFSAL